MYLALVMSDVKILPHDLNIGCLREGLLCGSHEEELPLVDHQVRVRRGAVEVADGLELANELIGSAHQGLAWSRETECRAHSA